MRLASNTVAKDGPAGDSISMPSSRLGALAIALLLMATDPVSASSIGSGIGRLQVDLRGLKFDLFTYRPNCPDPGLLLVFHGLNRKAESYRDYARSLGDRLCMIVAAPLFDRERFPPQRYQRGGIVRGNTVQQPADWTAQYVLDLIDWVGREEGRSLPYAMIGHSAGAQFLSRLAAFTPTRAQRIVIANPSTYVLASAHTKVPYGFGDMYPSGEEDAMLRRYLETPVTIYLGKEDVGGKNRNDSKAAQAQGATRYERGLNAYRIAQTLARSRGWRCNWRLVEVPGVGHSAAKMFGAPQALDAVSP